MSFLFLLQINLTSPYQMIFMSCFIYILCINYDNNIWAWQQMNMRTITWSPDLTLLFVNYCYQHHELRVQEFITTTIIYCYVYVMLQYYTSNVFWWNNYVVSMTFEKKNIEAIGRSELSFSKLNHVSKILQYQSVRIHWNNMCIAVLFQIKESRLRICQMSNGILNNEV